MRIRFLYVALLLISLFAECRKYEDGPLLSLRRAYERITGIWMIEGYYINGEDSTKNLQLETYVHKVVFDEWRYYPSNFSYAGVVTNKPIAGYDSLYGGGEGRWRFLNHNRYVQTSYHDNKNKHPYLMLNYQRNWKILRLSMNELWLSSERLGKQYEIRLSKTRDIKIQ